MWFRSFARVGQLTKGAAASLAHISSQANADRPVINSAGAIRDFEATATTLNTPIVLRDDFARVYGKPFISLGHYPLRGLAKPHELFVPVIGSQLARASS